MAREIERKFIVDATRFARELAPLLSVGHRLRQGYIWATPAGSVRVRTRGDKAWLTIKGAAQGIARDEFEYEIPVADADALLQGLARTMQVDKTRYTLRLGELTWEIDVFTGANAGLIIAEVELDDETQDLGLLPAWIEREVTSDPRYLNANLAQNPYKLWR